jgi:hypothetical protein
MKELLSDRWFKQSAEEIENDNQELEYLESENMEGEEILAPEDELVSTGDLVTEN